MTHVGRGGGGGHGGGHGHGHGGGFGFPGVYYDPWVFYDVNPEHDCTDAHKRHVVGEAGVFSTGTGALLVLGVLAWLVFEADRRVPR